MSKNSVSTDTRLKEFWRDNDRFSDLINAIIFNGRSIIKPESLHEMDTDMSGVVQFKDYEESLFRMRDVVKKSAYGIDFVILSLENQQTIHYGMPLRTMLYDGLGYLKEYQEISRIYQNTEDKNTKEKVDGIHKDESNESAKEAASKTLAKRENIKTKRNIKLDKAEFLSKFRKEDRLHPIISIVISYSEIPWDAPLTLRDMMKEMPPEMEGLFSDYRMNLVEVLDSGQYIFHNEDVKAVFEVCREIFQGNLDTVRNNYRDKDISVDAAAAIQSITNMSSLYEIKMKGGTETMNMCTALENLKNEGRQEEKIVIYVNCRKRGMSVEEAQSLVDIEDSLLEVAEEKFQSEK